MRKFVPTGEPREDIRRLTLLLNYSDALWSWAALTQDTGAVIGAVTPFGGVILDRSVFQRQLPDARWLVYAAGWGASDNVNPMVIELAYQKDNATFVTLGSVSITTSAPTKLAMGPFDVFATAGVPAGETLPCVRLRASKAAGAATGQLFAPWQIMLQLLPPTV